ncbi:hypothetical protein [Nocardioides aurantiacus]|uniref:Uncharacterized protein n=1 Tax=Nocardioides aurantiacus TaxID=86796 RepID=A0A3N2CR35_9ACTN|nr:hypothetical protein [Nocardioides aurantiacus]ROR89993.1 hypothetical protein EDD33_0825 [Nocardioides aurantiacus]
MPETPDDVIESHSARLHRIGVTFDDVEALECIWNGSEAFRLIADDRSGSLADYGYSVVDSLDAIWHELDASVAHLYMQHGFTPHQAFVLNEDRRAKTNLWGPDFDSDRLHELLDAKMPRPLLIQTLLVAESPLETETLIGAMTLDGMHPETYNPEPATAQVEARAASLKVQIHDCDCEF